MCQRHYTPLEIVYWTCVSGLIHLLNKSAGRVSAVLHTTSKGHQDMYQQPDALLKRTYRMCVSGSIHYLKESTGYVCQWPYTQLERVYRVYVSVVLYTTRKSLQDMYVSGPIHNLKELTGYVSVAL